MKSILRDLENPTITLDQLYQKIENDEFDHHITLLKENKDAKPETFEILTTLGKGNSGYAFLSLHQKKLVALRMSYDKEDFTDKFDSVKENIGENFKSFFLDILYPSIPVQHLHSGGLRKKKEITFDQTVYVSFWEKADALLENKFNENFRKKFKWFREFLQGLDIIHSKGRAHFDIKPDNLFIVDNQLKIGDFEFYWKIHDFIKSNDCLYCGTIGYIAPELFHHRESITTKIDIFSTGVTFARLFTGEPYRKDALPPEESRKQKELLKKCGKISYFDQSHLDEIKRSLSFSLFYRKCVKEKIKANTLEPLEKFVYEEILLKMMDPDPARRPDIREVIDKLETIEPTGPGIDKKSFAGEDRDAALEPPQPPKSPKSLWFIIGGLVVVTVSLFLYFVVFNKTETAKPPGSHKEKKLKPAVKEERKPPVTKKVNKPIEKKVDPTEIIKPGISPLEKERLINQGKYESYLDLAKERIADGEYERALEILDHARKINKDNRLLDMEKKIRQSMEAETQKSYNTYYEKALDNYERERYREALVNIGNARNVKNTPQLDTLEQKINRKLREREDMYKKGLALVEEYKGNQNYEQAKEIIEALKKLKITEHLLQLERETNRLLTQQLQEQQAVDKEYMEYLLRAKVYMDNGNLEEAEAEIEKARAIKVDEEFFQVEKRLKHLLGKRQREFEDHFQWAEICFFNGRLEEARRYAALAKAIGQTRELSELERKIEEKISERDREEAEKKADDDAFFNALRSGNVWDWDDYIREYPRGRHIDEAREKLDSILEDFIPRLEEPPPLIEEVAPDYPGRARRMRVSGIVSVEVTIDGFGNVTGVNVLEGHRYLRLAAKKAVRKWKYEPFIIGGKPRSVSFPVKVEVGPPEE